MNEEEKKAIKWFDTERKLVEITNGDNNYFFIILNYIDKLQKQNREYEYTITQMVLSRDENFVSKDKYQEIIDENYSLKEEIKMLKLYR